MTDEERKKLIDTRFVNCRLKDGKYYAVLSDGSEIEWSVYCRDKAAILSSIPKEPSK